MALTASAKPSHLLMASAFAEVGAGLGMVLAPDAMVTLLFGAGIETTTGWIIERLVGSALLALGTACWLARHDERSQAARAIIMAMLVYNTAAVAVFADAGVVLELQGRALWAVLLLHAALAVWCAACLWAFRLSRN